MAEQEIKGLFSYSGNKYKIFKNHLKNIVSQYDYVVELFAGSSPIVYNSKVSGYGVDVEPSIIFLHRSLSDVQLPKKVADTYEEFFPNGRNSDGYYNLRQYFNQEFIKHGFTPEIAPHFHLLVQLSFNSLIRFGPNGYNVPFGRKNIDLERIKTHSNIFIEKNLTFLNCSYLDFDLSSLDKEKTLLYFDPPYIASKYQYGGWNLENEITLLKFIDEKSKNGWKFILSNTFQHREVKNEILEEWSKDYYVKIIDKKYNSWSASVKSVMNEKNTIEVIISNFLI
jgi:DNA adenine methylase Dam